MTRSMARLLHEGLSTFIQKAKWEEFMKTEEHEMRNVLKDEGWEYPLDRVDSDALQHPAGYHSLEAPKQCCSTRPGTKTTTRVACLEACGSQELEEILSLSYMHLSHHLRSCFLFMAMFPEDENIRASRLIRLWVAEGFLKHHSGYSESIEEEAEEYLEDLVKRNLVIVNSKKSDGKIKCCGLHDMVRDLCIRKAHDEKFLHVIHGHVIPQSMINERRISLRLSSIADIWCPTAHSILCFELQSFPSSPTFLRRFRLLRILDAVSQRSKELPSQGGKFPFEDMSIIGSLPNLQVFKLRDQPFSKTWETTDGEFPQLRYLLIEKSGLQTWITESSHFPRLKHLVLRFCESLREIPQGIGEIPTLELIEVDSSNKSIVESAKQIAEDQQSYGNYDLHVRASYFSLNETLLSAHCNCLFFMFPFVVVAYGMFSAEVDQALDG
ncbi:putative late blight resistance protein homolog R1B-16 [Salvia hispanica]|uniref:putative late blight resistance protein homolog R1B-16 n=1 Tax=Salvia hispanica TaxID=49212 RepID=UPI002009714A|nr:putative late blight resistance protein homolog R1B-16 [Salvia hispanica]